MVPDQDQPQPFSGNSYGQRRQPATPVPDVQLMGMWDWDILTDHVLWSPNIEQVLGQRLGTLRDTYAAFLSIVHPADREEMMKQLNVAIEHIKAYQQQFRVVQTDGRIRRIQANGQVIADQSGRAIHMLGIIVEIASQSEESHRSTDDRQAEGLQSGTSLEDRNRLTFLVEVSRLLTSSLDYEVTLTTLAHLLIPEFADNCVIDLIAHDATIQRVAVAATDEIYEEALRELMRRYPPDPKGLTTRQTISEQHGRVVNHLTDEFYASVAQNEEHLALMKAAGGTSLLIAPLVYQGQSIGALSLGMTDSGRQFTVEELPLIEEVAYRAALAVAHARLYKEAQDEIQRRAQAEASLRQNEERLRTMLENMPVMVTAFAPDGTYILWNRECEVVTGYRADEIIGNPQAMEWLYPDPIYREETYQAWQDRLGDFHNWERQITIKDGSTRMIAWSSIARQHPIPGWSGWGIGVDLTERRRNEVAQRFLATTGEILGSSLDYELTLKNMARLVVPALADWCSVSIVAEDGYTLTVPVIANRDPLVEAQTYQVMTYYPLTMDSRFPSIEALKTGQVRLISEIPETLFDAIDDPQMREGGRAMNLTSALHIPLIVRDHRLGILTLYTTGSRPRFGPDDIPMMAELGRRAAVAIDNARLHQQAHEQRERLLVTLSSIGDAVIATDTNERVTFLNAVAESLTGWDQQEAISHDIKAIFNIVNEATRLPVTSPIARVLREGHVVGLANHTVLISKGGAEIPIDDSGAPIRDAEGNIVGAILVFRDISERKQAEAQQIQLYQQAVQAAVRIERLQKVTAGFAGALTIADVVAVFSSLATQAIGATAGSLVRLVDDRTLEVVGATNYDVDVVQLWRRFSLDAPVPLSEAVRSATPMWVASHENWLARYPSQPVSPQYTSWAALPLIVDGKSIGGIGFSFTEPQSFAEEDKTLMIALAIQATQALERVRLYAEVQAHAELLQQKVIERTAELQEALTRAQTADRAKSVMLANVSHEMRTPLSSIIGFSNLILTRNPDQDKRTQYMQFIHVEARRLATLINDFLDLQRIESGRQVFQLAEVDLALLVRDIISSQHVDENSVHHFVLDLDVTPSVFADQERIRQVILNLLSNAIKFSPNGGEIVLALRRQRGEVIFSIRDVGLGIPADELGRLFERFERGDAAEQLRIQGTGLGLALCKQIIKNHQGRIWAESDGPERGTTFSFALPTN